MADRLSVGSALKAARQATGARQAAIAELMKCSAAALSHVEAGRTKASPELIEKYASQVIDQAKDRARFVEAFSEQVLPVQRLADLVSPDKPQLFVELYWEARRKARERRDEDEVDIAFNDVRRELLTSSSAVEASSSPRRVANVLERLTNFLASSGGIALAPRESVVVGSGSRLSCDLMDVTRNLMFEIKTTSAINQKTALELLGSSLLMKKRGFKLVVCLTEMPARDDEVVSTLRDGDIPVIWPSADDDSAFDGDPII